LGTRNVRTTDRYSETGILEFKGGAKLASRRYVLNGTDLHAAIVGFANPEAGAIIIKDVIVHVTTVATGACTLDIGTTAVSATTTSDNLIDGLDVNAATGAFSDPGTNGKPAQLLASGKWITVDEKTGDATGLVGTLTILYLIP
jgi:hypothetical protein